MWRLSVPDVTPAAFRFASPAESVIPWQAHPVRFGPGATQEIGYEARALGMTRVLVVTDANVSATGLPDAVAERLGTYGIEAEVWAGTRAEPTDASIERGLTDLRDRPAYDGYVAVGGGSSVDTCKLLNLLLTHPAPLTRYLAAPHGEAAAIPGPLPPIIGVPTTAGTGSECTPTAVVDLHEQHVKAAVSSPLLRPRLAIVDPLNTLTMPPAVTAGTGYDALVQAIESYTARPYASRPPAADPSARPAFYGANPFCDAFGEPALRLMGRYLRRAVLDGGDLEARYAMSQAALFSRLGLAGVHIPHAAGYGVAGTAHAYRPPGYPVDHPMVPHGFSVAVTAPAAIAFVQPAVPERVDRAAELLGVPAQARALDPRRALSDWLRELIADTGGPVTLEHFGLTRADLPELVDRTVTQTRLLTCTPRPVGREELTAVFEASFEDGRTAG
ncbi:MAG: iron-containing alcohol dehydrogenase [Streptosporangiales bacterium]|nr:iron-containing alcohol dehydrogenase [Streptosporangiales bacterium]